MKNIVVIGAGQLGSRHLQGLSRINFKARINVIDPSIESLDLARERFNEMPKNSSIVDISYFAQVSQIAKQVDLAIIATNADIRAKVIRELMTHCEVKNLVLEKILFQRVDDYNEIEALLESKEVMVWVNHPRRMFPYYEELAKSLIGSKQISYKVEGGGWGLACNGLHFIDHLAFLTGCDSLIINASGLNQIVSQGKRKGYLEVDGTLCGKIGGHSFELFCHEKPSPLIITISTDNLIAVIDEENGCVRIAKKSGGWRWTEKRVKIAHFQSELSDRVAQDILVMNKCNLPTFAEATKLHIPFINSMLDHINLYSNEKYSACPIT